MKGKIDKNPQLNVFRVPLVSIINMEHELVVLANRIDWASVEKEFSIYYPLFGKTSSTHKEDGWQYVIEADV